MSAGNGSLDTVVAQLSTRVIANEDHVAELTAKLEVFKAELLRALGITTKAVIDEATDLRGRLIEIEGILTKKRPRRRKRR